MNAAGLVDDEHCVACGSQAEAGLHMHFAPEGDGVISRLTVSRRFAGWRSIVHGGAVAMMLDEAMAYAAGARGFVAVTGELTMRFRRQVLVDAPLAVRGNVVWQRGDVLGLEASVHDADGTLLARATGRFVRRGTLGPGERFGTMHVGG